MAALDNPNFWSSPLSTPATLQNDGCFKYILLDKTYQMLPLVRDTDTTFTDFLKSNSDAQKCKVIVNGNFYDLDKTGTAVALMTYVGLRSTLDPKDTSIQGQIVKSGKVVAGDSRPQSFWFGQIKAATRDAWGWTYTAQKGDPPAAASTLAAVGGVGPLISGSLKYGVGNLYKPGAAASVPEPATGDPPAAALPYLIQRNNETFKAANSNPKAGKAIIAYCSSRRTLLVAVQPQHGVKTPKSHADLGLALTQRGFDAAVFLDGSDSVTLMVDGKLEETPGDRKNETNDVGIGFYTT